MSDNAPLPCPFCNGEPHLEKVLRDGCKDGEPDAWAYWLQCNSCAASGPWSKNQFGAFNQWNIRMNDPSKLKMNSQKPFSYNGMFFLREDFSQGWARLVLADNADTWGFDKIIGEAPDYILRCSFQAMLELGLPCNPQTAARLLEDWNYFFSVLPYPPESLYWNEHRDYGIAGLLWSWWMRPFPSGKQLDDVNRKSFADKIKKVDQAAISKVLMELWQMSE